MKKELQNRAGQALTVGPFPHEAKDVVGTGHRFTSIEDLLQPENWGMFYKNMLVKDADNMLTWQLYYDSVGEEWLARVFDGRFIVKACDAAGDGVSFLGNPGYFNGLPAQGMDGVTLEDGDIVLITRTLWPQLHGIWIVHSGNWERHPIFDQAAEKLTGITFIVANGDVYKNTQWVYTTVGDVTPETLSPDFTTWVQDPELWDTYTWLNFEMIGGVHPVFIPDPMSDLFIDRNDFLTINSQQGNVVIRYPLPGKTYSILSNVDGETVYEFPGFFTDPNFMTESEVPLTWVLLEFGDWIDFTLGSNNGRDFLIRSNRLNKILIEPEIDEDGKLTYDVPDGYKLYAIHGIASNVSNDTPILNIGTTALGSDIAAGEGFLNGTLRTLLPLTPVSGPQEIYVSEADTGYWYGATLQFILQIVKEG